MFMYHLKGQLFTIPEMIELNGISYLQSNLEEKI
jgi:hypothetical protein